MNTNTLAAFVRQKYPAEYELVIVGGRLTDDWANAARHCFIQSAASEELGKLLGLDDAAVQRLAATAACHDWKKRLERKPQEFTGIEKEKADLLYLTVNPDEELMGALTPWFLPKVLRGEATFLQLVQFLVDDMTRNDEFVTFDERIDEVSVRNPDPEPEVTKALGRPYWEVEREIGHRVEQMVFAILSARHVPITTPSELAAKINEALTARFGA